MKIVVALLATFTAYFHYANGATVPPLVFLGGTSSTKLESFSLTTAVRRSVTLGSSSYTPGGIAYDGARNQIFLTFSNYGSILETRLDGNGNRTIFTADATGVTGITGIAYDGVAQNLYFFSEASKRIGVCSLTMYSCTTLVTYTYVVKDIAVHPTTGTMYWTVYATPGYIRKSLMDGTDRVDLIPSLYYATGLTVDQEQSRLYWSDSDGISSSDLDGGDRQLVIADADAVQSVLGIAIFEDTIYWNQAGSSIRSASKKNNGTDTTSILDAATQEFKHPLILAAAIGKPTARPNDCANFPCSDICVLNNVSYTCLCRRGYFLDSDGKSCRDLSDNLVYLSEDSLAARVETTGLNKTVQTSFGLGGKRPAGLAVDVNGGRVFWSYNFKNGIHGRKLEGNETEMVIVTDGVSVRGMAYDWLEDNIYYTDDAMGHVGVCSVKTQACTVIADEDVDAPYGIALALRSSRFIFWTQTGSPTAIWRADMDGGNASIIVSSGLTYPTAITVDDQPLLHYVYWLDEADHLVNKVDFNAGGTPSPVYTITAGSVVGGISVFYNRLYYSRYLDGSSTVNRVRIGYTTLETFLSAPTGKKFGEIAFISSELQSTNGTSNCADIQCSHICVGLELSHRCLCPRGLELESDGITCVDSSNSTINGILLVS